MPDCNGWPNRATWLLACWLSSDNYAYKAGVILARWGRMVSEPRGSELARSEVAAKFERDVRGSMKQVVLYDSTTGETIPATEEILADVDWNALADRRLKRFQDYEPLSEQ
jgi:hypothetical protein